MRMHSMEQALHLLNIPVYIWSRRPSPATYGETLRLNRNASK